jgi:RNA polymerase sigma-70 factor (ECF subfamily)
VCGWCRRWGLQDADAQDVTQQVLLKLAGQMGAFAYDPGRSFRAWLKTLAHHAWRDFVDGQGRDGPVGGEEARRLLESLPARDDLAGRLEEQFNHDLLEEAMARVRLRVDRRTWEAFRLLALDGLSGAEAARRTGLPVAHAFVARSRVQRLLREEVRRLDG